MFQAHVQTLVEAGGGGSAGELYIDECRCSFTYHENGVPSQFRAVIWPDRGEYRRGSVGVSVPTPLRAHRENGQMVYAGQPIHYPPGTDTAIFDRNGDVRFVQLVPAYLRIPMKVQSQKFYYGLVTIDRHYTYGYERFDIARMIDEKLLPEPAED